MLDPIFSRLTCLTNPLTVKLMHSGPIRPQDIGNAVRSSPSCAKTRPF